MQAEIPPTVKRSSANEQTAHTVMCPLCSTLLMIREIPPQQTIVMCPDCGYSAPYIQRQHHVSEISPVQRQPVGSSVWIDPTVSAYLAGALKGNAIVEHSPSPQSAAPKTRPLNPPTPIPPRASAQHPNAVKVRPKYSRTHTQPLHEEGDLTRIPTLPPPTMWQYESPQFEAESSLSSLSLVIDTPTQPQGLPELPVPIDRPTTPSPMPGKHIIDIDEIDTLPRQLSPSLMPVQLSPSASRTVDIDQIDTQPHKPIQNITDIDEIDTLSPRIVASIAPRSSTSLVPTHAVPSSPPVRLPMSPTATSNVVAASALTEQVISIAEPSSWTAGGMRESSYARRLVDRSRGRKHKRTKPTTPTMHTLDYVRWWLLHPGRLEGLLWLGGTLLLITVTFALLIVSAISFSWILPRTQSDNASSLTATAGAPTSMPTVITSHGLTVILENARLLVPGQPIQLRGRGFSPRGQVTFIDEHHQPLFVQDAQTNTVMADQHGTFAVSLMASTWAVGTHNLFVRDDTTKQVATVPITLFAGPFGKNATATVPPGVTPTAPTGQGGTFPTPVNATPAPITPTVSSATPLPTPTQVKPTATPTMGITPTTTPGTTPTVGTTPSPGTTPSTNGQNNGMIITAGSASLGSSGNSGLNSWAWLLIAGYSLAMLLFGLTALLRKRQS